MVTILHASDVHFGKPYNASVGEAFQVAAQEIAADLIVVSGDLTQRAKVKEFRAASAWLARLPQVPLVTTPGNHDVPLYRVLERVTAPYRNYRKYISERLDFMTRIPGVTVVSLNSTAPLRAIVNGRIDKRQLAFAARVFQEADPSDTRVIVAHHHFAPAPDYEDDRAMPGAREVLEALNDMQVELILGGHLHRSYVGNSLDVCTGANNEHGIVIVQSGTTSSHRGRAREKAKNSFNVVRIAPDHLEITHFMYFSELDRFAPFSMHALPRRDSGYFLRDPFLGSGLRGEAGDEGLREAAGETSGELR